MIQEQTINYIIQYLLDRPYKEVYQLIAMIQNDLQPIQQPVKGNKKESKDNAKE